MSGRGHRLGWRINPVASRININVLLFALIRERIGKSELRIELPEESTLQDLQKRLGDEYPALSALLSVCRFSVNAEYASGDRVLTEGAEVGVIPPVSGGSGPAEEVLHAKIVRSPIKLETLISKVSSPTCGAILTFAGAVRQDTDTRKSVVRIAYEGYESMSEEVLRRIAETAARAHHARVAVEHRLGSLQIGETSVGIAVASPHRADGFAALREIIESIKKDLPIWKKEEFSDGSTEWVNCRMEKH